MSVKLIVENKQHKGREIDLTAALKIQIGRDAGCSVQILEESVSRVHCMIEKIGPHYKVTDLNSSNGTFINDQRIKNAILNNGDTLRCGELRMKFTRRDESENEIRLVENAPEESGITFIQAPNIEESSLMNLGAMEQSVENYKKAHESLKALYRISNSLYGSESMDAVYTAILDNLKTVISADRFFILLYEPEARRIHIQRSAGVFPGKQVMFSRTIIEETIKRREVVRSSNAAEDEQFESGASIVMANIKSVISAPLEFGGEVYGVLYLDSQRFRAAFTQDDAELVGAFARQAAAAIHRHKLIEDLENLFKSTVRTLAAAIEVKDPYTCGHSERVTQYSLDMADAMGMEPNRREELELAALLHDVGKIGIPENVLNKNGPLDDTEFMLVKNHPAMGYGIVRNIKNIGNIALGVKHHHEKYDGTGYPDKLKGTDIPLIARIIAVGDTFDAMTSDRPYRKAMPTEKALAEIEKCAATQFDPELSEIFVKMYNEKYIASGHKATVEA